MASLLQPPPLPLLLLRRPFLLFFPPPPPYRTVGFYSNPSSKSLRRNIGLASPRVPRALPTSDQDLLRALSGSDAGDKALSHLPAVRSYENDLARLTLIGSVGFDQALTAAAADGGDAAEEHLSSGMETMVVETVFPGSKDEHSTVSTRLFLPAQKVKEKAKRLRSRLTADMLSGAMSSNILAMTFRQVVVQHMWSFELVLFPPGSERTMEDLTNPREIPVHVAVSSSNGKILATVAEVVCSSALESVEEHMHNMGGTAPRNIVGWFQKNQKTASADSSVCIFRISESEIVEEAKQKAKRFNLANRTTPKERNSKHKWWVPPTSSSLDKDKVGFPGFSTWTNEFIPAYKIHVDGNKFKNVKFQGWQKLADNRWEILLTHFQMVELANILDMFYEDRYTVPEKQLMCGRIAKLSHFSKNKSSFWKMVPLALACGAVLVSFGIMAHIFSPQLFKARKSLVTDASVALSDTDCCQLQSLGADELESLCLSVVRKIKDAISRPGDIMVDRMVGAWTGELPIYLNKAGDADIVPELVSNSEAATSHADGGVPDHADLSAKSQSAKGKNVGMEMNSVQDIASYQVVMTRDGEIIGFQPTSRVAVNNWASNPLAKALYRGRALSPGLLEPRLQIPQPENIAVIELLMSINPNSWFVLARPFRL